MSQNSETIEARLAAYVDGDLDAAGRAEIEKHLAANPQHRKMMQELMETRTMLRALPREKAPIELVETLQGQLERSSLLGQDGGVGEVIRISRWPQIVSVAAILLLAVGLATVVYVVVSPGQGPSYTINTPAPMVEESDATERKEIATERPAPMDAKDAPKSEALKSEEADKASANEPVAVPLARGLTTMQSVEVEGEKLDESTAKAPVASNNVKTFDADESEQAKERMREVITAKKVTPESLVLLVEGPDVATIGLEITDYLSDNHLPYESATESHQQFRQVRDELGATTALAQDQMGARQDLGKVKTETGDSSQETQTTSRPAESLADGRMSVEEKGAKQTPVAPAAPDAVEADATSAYTTGPATAESLALNSLNSSDEAEGDVIIIRQVTRRQATELRKTILTNEYQQRNRNRAKDQQTLTTAPSTQTFVDIAQDQARQEQSAGGGAGAAEASPVTQPATSPSTRPASDTTQSDQNAPSLNESAPAPQVVELQALAPTTMPLPAHATTSPAEELVDVVILVQRSASPIAPPASISPATQPEAEAVVPMPATAPSTGPATVPSP